MRRFSGGVKGLGEIRINDCVAIRIVLPRRTSASIIYPRANVARLARVKQATTAQMVESIVRDVLVVRIGRRIRRIRAQTAGASISTRLLQAARVIILVSAIEPVVS